MTPVSYMRDKSWSVSLSVDNKPYGYWKTLDGGDTTSDATLEYPGGAQPGVQVPGVTKVTDAITLTRQFDRLRDAQGAYDELNSYIGTGSEARVTQTPLDEKNQAFGKPIVNVGIITGVTRPKADAASDTVSTFTVTVAPHSA